MKKKITILFLMLVTFINIGFCATYGDGCGGDCGLHVYKQYDGSQWTYASQYLSKSGTIKDVQISAEPSTTDGEKKVKFNVHIEFEDWQTYLRESSVYGYVARYGSFDIKCTYYIGNRTIEKNYTYKRTPDINGDWSGADSDWYMDIRECDYSEEFYVPFEQNPAKSSLDCYVNVSIIPTNTDYRDTPTYGYHYQKRWGYSNKHTINYCRTRSSNVPSNSISIDFDKGSHSIIANNTYTNPLVNGNYLIYNNPKAKVNISLKTDAKKTKSVSGSKYYGYSTFIKRTDSESEYKTINNSIVKLDNITNNESDNILYTNEYTLNELGVNTAGKIINISHRLYYTINSTTTPKINEMLDTPNNFRLASNVIRFKVAPTVEFKSTNETETIYKCYSESVVSDENFNFGIKDKELYLTTSNTGLSINDYNPQYSWEMSKEEGIWSSIDENKFYYNGSTIASLSGSAIILRSNIVKEGPVKIRKRAILKAFGSKEKNALYTDYNEDTKLYHIAVTSQEVTLKKLPTPNNNNFSITTEKMDRNYISDNKTLIYENNDPFKGKKINFKFIKDENQDEGEYNALNTIASKTLTITKENGEIITTNNLPYTINDYKKGEWKFDCKIEFCNGTSIGKSFTINSYPGIFFSTNSNEKNIYKLYSKDIKNDDERYIISLISDNITTTNQYLTEEDLKTEYSWEFSYDKKTWQKIDEKYIIKPTVIIGKGDTHISSTLLGDNSEVYVRQKAILKGFSQNTENSTFNELIDGKYYIGETSDIYTIKKLPNITNDNITFTSGAGYASKDMITCYDNVDSYNGLNIEFNVTADANITEEELEAIRNNATYSIKRTKTTFEGNSVVEDVTKTLTPNKHIVTGFTPGVEEMKYTCTVTYNGVNFVKTLTLKSYPEEKIDINKIETQTNGASIVSRDIAQMRIQAVCPKGEEFKIKYYLEDAIRPNIAAYESKIEYTCPEYPEMVPYEDVVPFVPYPEMVPYPEYEPTDFSTWKFGELEDLIISKGWDAGIYWEDVTIGFLKNTARDKEEAEYYQLKQGYEMQYDIDKLAYEQQYEADKQAYIDDYNTKKAEFEAGCAAKITWQEFNDNLNYTTTLENITENKDNAVFYMRTKSTDDNGACYSGVVTINVTYIDGISNNLIEFVGDEYKGKDSIIVTAGEGNPAIKGELVEGGFGIPKDDSDCIYSYSWKYYNEALSTWEKLVDDNGNELMFDEFNTNDGNRAEIRNVSLEADILKNAIASNPKGLKIARFVSSYKINEMSSKMEYMSNVLVIFSSKLIEDDKFTYEKSDKFCPGAGSVNILFTDVELEENEVLDVKVLEKDQEDLEKVFNYEKRYVSIVNPYKDFNVSICRRDTITNVKSNEVGLEIDIPEFKADFMVSVDYIDHELTEDRINVQSGSRVKLINTTVDEIGGTLYNWTLQVQKDGLLAQPSEKESPVCYLYNPGLNQIRLEVINSNKCKSVVTADNIFVTGLPDNRSSSFFADDEANEQMLATESYIRVYPTILIDENIVNVQSNIERYDVVITDVAGKVMLVAENLTMSSTLDLAFLPNGIYILNASGNAFKLIKK